MHFPALTRPRVSIVICNYNYARYLDQAVRSAVEQSYPTEVIVVDDGSTDESREVLEPWRARVKVIHQANAGQRGAYNTGFAHTTGDVVIFLDSDDYLLPGAAAKIAESFGEDVVKVHYRMRVVDGEGRPLGVTIPTRLASGDVLPKLLSPGLLHASPPGSGNAYRRDALERLIPLPAEAAERHAADFFTINGIVVFGKVAKIEAAQACYRLHAQVAPGGGAVFGNAVQGFDELERFDERNREFRRWLLDRTAGRVVVPDELLEFSKAKCALAQRRYASPYLAGVRSGGTVLPRLLRALWAEDGFGLGARLGLSAWALVVLLAPRPVGYPLARYVVDPSSRKGKAPGPARAPAPTAPPAPVGAPAPRAPASDPTSVSRAPGT